MSIKWACIALFIGGAAVCTASADTISGYTYQVGGNSVITNGQNPVIGSQIKIWLKDDGPAANSVTFHFENIGSFTDSITEIYFQDGSWLQPPPTILSNTSTVQWQVGANPGHVPGSGSDPSQPNYFVADASLSSQSLPGNANGINNNPNPQVQGDWLDLTFKYVSGQNYQSVIDGLNQSDVTKRLAIGFHVTGYFSSASVITTPSSSPMITTPLPSTAAMSSVLFGLFAVVRVVRRRTNLC